MTRPKLTHYKRPLLFFQNGDPKEHYNGGSRLRIIRPDGKMQWMPYFAADCECEWRSVCYGEDYGFDDAGVYAKFPSARAAVTAMRKYDKEQGYERADFLGYL